VRHRQRSRGTDILVRRYGCSPGFAFPDPYPELAPRSFQEDQEIAGSCRTDTSCRGSFGDPKTSLVREVAGDIRAEDKEGTRRSVDKSGFLTGKQGKGKAERQRESRAFSLNEGGGRERLDGAKNATTAKWDTFGSESSSTTSLRNLYVCARAPVSHLRSPLIYDTHGRPETP